MGRELQGNLATYKFGYGGLSFRIFNSWALHVSHSIRLHLVTFFAVLQPSTPCVRSWALEVISRSPPLALRIFRTS